MRRGRGTGYSSYLDHIGSFFFWVLPVLDMSQYVSKVMLHVHTDSQQSLLSFEM